MNHHYNTAPIRSGTRSQLAEKFIHFCKSTRVQKNYMRLAVCILLVSTAYWALLAARVHTTNADQLVNPYMFQSFATFKGAVFPAQHTYLLKWPVFFLIFLFGETDASYKIASVSLAVLTVAIFAALLHKIEHRNAAYGTLILAISSALFLIPAQPYPGGLLPVNMGMAANRNIEYAIFILCLCWIAVSHKWFSRTMAYATIGLYVLMLSDSLFFALSLGGSFVGILLFYVLRRRQALRVSLNWLLLSGGAAFLSRLTLWAINKTGITHISGASEPYALTHSAATAAKGLLYTGTNLATNYGANPAFSSNFLHSLVSTATKNLFGWSGLSLILNATFLLATIVICIVATRRILHKNASQDTSYILTAMMLLVSAACIASFALTKHYFPVDARYLTIVFFAFTLVVALQLRKVHLQSHFYILIGGLFMFGMFFALPGVQALSQKEQSASSEIMARNNLIVRTLKSHQVDTLVGDYWRVIPIRQKSMGLIDVTPMATCTEPRTVLTSRTWQPNLENVSFAYLLSSDKPQTDFPACSIDTITVKYGKPNATFLISGTIDSPKEQLLFYDYGAHNTEHLTGTSESSIAPISIEALQNTQCRDSSTIMNIVAHEDDDLLFINPDTLHAIQAGNCVRSVYITAGDTGASEQYWLGREQGAKDAYATMIGNGPIWTERTIKVGDGQFIYIAQPKNNPKITLIFLRLPDGNTRGEGFGPTSRQSMQKLFTGQIPSLHAVYGNTAFTKQGLVDTLNTLMSTYKPDEVRTLSTYADKKLPDHSDHAATSRFADLALKQYALQSSTKQPATLKHYVGYPIHMMSENLGGPDLDLKSRAFFSYAKHDPAVCQSPDECARGSAYNFYLRRMYRNEN